MEGDDRPVVRNEKISGEDVSLNVDGGVGIDEELVPVSNSSESAFPFEQPQEWITDVPEVAEEISIGLTSATEPIFGEELIEEIPPPSPPQVEAEAELVEPAPEPEPSSSSPAAPFDDILPPLTAALLPPHQTQPPPPVVKVKPLPGVAKRFDIPFDFYFHNKSPDHRHLCPFCTESGSTLTNIRFHVIRLHPEKLFALDRALRYPLKNFRKVCDTALASVTKEAETGERNPTGTKQIVNCIYCRGSPKSYNDKRAFLCHMILNHYPVISKKILEIQKEEGYESKYEAEEPTTAVTSTPSTEVVPSDESTPAASAVPTSPPPPIITNGTPEKKNGSTKKPKKRPSSDRKSNSPKTPKKKKKSEAVATSTTTTTETAKGKKAKEKADKKKEKDKKDEFNFPGKYDCDLCGKRLSSSTSRWRHKARYCNVAKDLRDQHLYAGLDQEEEEATANHSLSLDGSSSADVSLETSKYLGMDEMSGVGVGIDDHDHLNSTSHHEKIEMEMMMMFQDTNEDFMKLHGNSGEMDDDEDGNEQFLSDFQEFYDENEVNDVLLTMTMDGAHSEDPLHI